MCRLVKLLSIILLASGCSSMVDGSAGSAAGRGALGGAALGAGTGAAVGSMISGGQVGPSALVGGGIGLAVGATGAITYRHLKREERIQQGNTVISSQQATIEHNQQDIERMRSNLADEASSLGEAVGSQILPFQGVTVNNPY